jgi:hypothetical protein
MKQMKKIPIYFINKVIAQAGNRAKDLLHEIVKEPFHDFVEAIVLDAFLGKNTNDVRSHVLKNQFQKTKKRWYQALKKSIEIDEGKKKKTELLGEIEIGKEIEKLHGVEGFKKIYQVDSYEELKELRLKQTEEWTIDKSKKLIDYFYIRDKTKNQIEKALVVDITLTICDVLLKEFNGDLNDIVIVEPDFFVEHPVKTESKGKLNLSKEAINVDDRTYYYEEYQPSSAYSFLTLIDKTFLENPEIENKYLKSLDDTDWQIFVEVMKRQTLDFVRERQIFIDIGDIVKKVYQSDNSKNYKMIVTKLQKMANITFNVIQDDKLVVFGIFDNFEVERYSDGGRKALITVNDKIHQQYINDQVTRMYSDKINKFELETSKKLIFPLQKQRINCYLTGSDYTTAFTYDSFMHKMRFNGSRKKRDTIRLIENSLQEFVDKGVTIKGYKRIGDEFHIEFLPIETYEVEDLIKTYKENPQLELPLEVSVPE